MQPHPCPLPTVPRPATGGRAAARPHSAFTCAAAALFLGLASLAAPAPSAADSAGEKAARSAEDLTIVDCLLPQKVRRLGRRSTYLQPRQPIRATAAECRIRGGEYTEPDQASYATSLQVWLPQAKGGDAEAQYYVGQIFERGLGSTPDPASAAEWYRKAADQDYAPAQVALGYLYELGLGVAADEAEALRWYRRAAGLAEDLVILEQAEYQALEEARRELGSSRQKIETLEKQVEELERQVRELEAEGEEGKSRSATLQTLIEALQSTLAEERRREATSRERIAELEEEVADAEARASAATSAAPSGVATASLDQLSFGDYHALVIGNANYDTLPPLTGSRESAEHLARVLREKYGFEVKLLLDADRLQILEAFDELREELDTRDNLLVYYTGHGERDATGQTAYWQGVDAAPSRPVSWIPSALVAEHLDLIAANHVFLVADSVFSGLRTRSSVARLPTGRTEEERYHHVKQLLDRRARLVLASGSEPQDSSGPSAFSRALVSALDANSGLLEASSLYRAVNDAVSSERASGVEFATLKWARHDLSDFFFVPRGAR
ncbi:MAG: caspase family protein [Holophagales bacterium]|nr:caspase family protein [Holophagales bacterium]